MGDKYEALLRHLRKVALLQGVNSVLNWDQQVMMPAGGIEIRAEQVATIQEMEHELFTGDLTARLLDEAEAELQNADYDSDEASMVRVIRQDYEEQTRLPSEFVARVARVTSRSLQAWEEAYKQDDFSLFAPELEKVVDVLREACDLYGYEDHPYSALLNTYDRGMTTTDVRRIFDGHKADLIALVNDIAQVQDRVDDSFLKKHYPIDKQHAFGMHVVKQLGFDFERGREDISTHPFSTTFSRGDVRITTRFKEDDFNQALYGFIHETGHGLYEQGSAESLEGTPLAGGSSLSVHESQSRMWENVVGRSREFWEWALPQAKVIFPEQLEGVDVDAMYKAVNKVQRDFIRVEADEATYNLHIMLRFDIEQGLMDGSIKVNELPKVWNEKFEEYFGLTPPSDKEGVLQDIHWSDGGIGYFPTYALGNLLSIQYYNVALNQHPDIPQKVAQGDFGTLLAWAQEHIYRHSRKFTSAEITRRITGTVIDSRPYIEYLKKKYSDIYGL